MATYYVKQASDGGSDSADGLTPATAWATVSFALGGTTAITGGDTLYVAPGRYLSVASTSPIVVAPSSVITVIGDVDASEFPGISAGLVRITSHMSGDNAAGLTNRYPVVATSKNNFSWQNIIFNGPCWLTTCSNWTFSKCVFHLDFTVNLVTLTECTSISFDKCLFFGSRIGSSRCIAYNYATQASNFDVSCNINDCIFYTTGISRQIEVVLSGASAGNPTGITAYNNTHFGYNTTVYRVTGSANSATVMSVYNALIFCDTASAHFSAQVSGQLIEDYNRVSGIIRTNVPTGANTVSTATYYGADFGHYAVTRLGQIYPFASHPASLSESFGTSTNAPVADIYGNTWSGASPDAGAITYRSVSVGTYNPTERNASSVTISPNATSKTLHLYLGSTGLFYNTSGLSARFTRSGSNSVAISLVSQTSNGAWLSGGFAEIDAINQPGLYRLDVPNAAFVSGVDRVTVTVRGASGTNGAVVDCQLISSQLDLTQAVPTSNTANTIGDCLNAARAQGFGKWSVTGTTLRLYAPDGTTVVRTFTLDSETSPSQRV